MKEPTEAMADAARGIIQLLRVVPGCTFKRLREHCVARGDDLKLWPDWALVADSYVTEQGAAALIYTVMSAAATQEGK